MKIKELRGAYFSVTFDEQIPFTDYHKDDPDDSYTTGIFSLDELKSFVEMGRNYLENHERMSDPTNVDTDPPDEYNVYSDQDGHACNTTVDGG